MKRKLVLASASPRRREILTQLGLDFTICPACGEEKLTTADPEEAVKALALQKAREVAGRLVSDGRGGALVIGADTVVACDKQILGKPADAADAERMLRTLSGREHMVYTGVAVVEGGSAQTLLHFAEGTRVEMYPMPEAWIHAYVMTGEPMDKAGAYAIQGGCMPWIRGICGEYQNVVGFPAARFYQELRAIGIDLLAEREEQ